MLIINNVESLGEILHRISTKKISSLKFENEFKKKHCKPYKVNKIQNKHIIK